MKKFFIASAFVFTLLSPATTQAAGLTTAQVEAVMGLLSAFGADAATIANVRATLGGGATVAPAGSLSFAASAQPATTPATRGAKAVPFTTVTLTNNTSGSVQIYTLTLERVGTATDSSLRAVAFTNAAGTILSQTTSLDSKHQTTLSPSLSLNAGQSVTLTAVGDISTGARKGKMLGLRIVAINASAPISGSLPISGTLQKVE